MRSPKYRCFVSAPGGEAGEAVASRISQALREIDVESVGPDNIGPGVPIPGALKDLMEQCDFMIAVVTGASPNVMYEIGFASAMRKPLILVTQSPATIPSDIRSSLWVRYEESLQGLEDFGKILKILVSAGPEALVRAMPPRRSAKVKERAQGFSRQRYEQLVARVAAVPPGPEAAVALERLVQYLFETSPHFDIEAARLQGRPLPGARKEVDLVVWNRGTSSVLRLYRNPVAVETKLTGRTRTLSSSGFRSWLSRLVPLGAGSLILFVWDPGVPSLSRRLTHMRWAGLPVALVKGEELRLLRSTDDFTRLLGSKTRDAARRARA